MLTISQIRSAWSSEIPPKEQEQTQLSFTISPAHPEVGEVVQFSEGSRDKIIYWRWDFGDGTTWTDPDPLNNNAATDVGCDEDAHAQP